VREEEERRKGGRGGSGGGPREGRQGTANESQRERTLNFLCNKFQYH